MKKILRYVAMVVLVLLLVFLSLGLFIPVVEYETSIIVDKPVAEAFALYNDRSNIKQWIPEIQVMEPIAETPEVVGSKYRMVINSNGDVTEMVETVTSYTINEEVGIHFDAGMMQKDDTYIFEDMGSKTKITGKHGARGDSYYARCVFALFKGVFTEIDQGYMDRFKIWAESE